MKKIIRAIGTGARLVFIALFLIGIALAFIEYFRVFGGMLLGGGQ